MCSMQQLSLHPRLILYTCLIFFSTSLLTSLPFASTLSFARPYWSLTSSTVGFALTLAVSMASPARWLNLSRTVDPSEEGEELPLEEEEEGLLEEEEEGGEREGGRTRRPGEE